MAAAGAAGAVLVLPPERPVEWFQLVCFGILALCGVGLAIEARARPDDAGDE